MRRHYRAIASPALALAGLGYAAVIGFLVAINAYSAVIVALPIAIIVVLPELPTWPLLVGLIAVRAVLDNAGAPGGVLHFSGGTAVADAALVILGVSVVLRRQRGMGPIVVVGILAYLSNTMAAESWGPTVHKELLRDISVLAVVAVGMNLKKIPQAQQIARSVQVIAFIPAVLCIYQLVTHTGLIIDGELRPAGTLVHPNSAAMVFGIALLCSIYRVVNRSGRRLELLLGLLFAVALIATKSLGGFVGTAIMLAGFLVMSPARRAGDRLRWLVAMGVGTAALVFSPTVQHRLAGLGGGQTQGTATMSLAWRLRHWGELTTLIPKSLWIGQGLGATTSGRIVVGSLPHNEYLRGLVEIGVLGMAIILGCTAATVVVLYRRLQRRIPGDDAALVISVILGLAANAFAANTFLYPITSLIFALMLSVSIARESGTPAPEENGPRAPEYNEFREEMSGTTHETFGY